MPLNKPEARTRAGTARSPRAAHGARAYTSGNVLRIQIAHPWRNPRVGGGPRGSVTAWSAASRRRLRTALHRIDWQSRSWALVTLTLPGDLADCDYDPAYLKASLRALLKRLNRRAHRPLLYAWKLEWQRRGAAHFHLVIELAGGDLPWLRREVATAWHQLVGRDQSAHLDAGTRVERAFTTAAIANYLAKELDGGTGKAYQHHLPDRVSHPGRWWGHSRTLPQPWHLTILRYSAAYAMRRTASRLATSSPRYHRQLERQRARWTGRTDLYTGPPARSTLARLTDCYCPDSAAPST